MSHGKICYLDIPAITAEASAGFYSSIFGWTVRKRGDGELAFDDTGGVSGTWVKESDRTPDEQTRIYIMVDDISDNPFGLAASLHRYTALEAAGLEIPGLWPRVE